MMLSSPVAFKTRSTALLPVTTRLQKELQNTIEKLLEEVKYQPIVLGSDISTDLVTYQSLRLLIASAIYATSLWPDLAQAFDAVFTRNQTSYVEASTVLTGAIGRPALSAICRAGEFARYPVQRLGVQDR